jgi:hypothetical protein
LPRSADPFIIVAILKLSEIIMKWVTRDHVHMDRVASPWLIRRFIDPTAEFVFVPFAETRGKSIDADLALPTDAIAFGIPGSELGPHDESGSTFRKLIRKYTLDDPALEFMVAIIESGIRHVFHHREAGYSVAHLQHAEGVGLDALALGMLYLSVDDARNIQQSMVIYDALYAYCAGNLFWKEHPALAALPVPKGWDEVKNELRRRLPWAACYADPA